MLPIIVWEGKQQQYTGTANFIFNAILNFVAFFLQNLNWNQENLLKKCFTISTT